jgi:hypothetical protein
MRNLLFLLAIPLVACTAEVGSAPPTGTDLTIDNLDSTTVSGSFVNAGAVIAFRAHSADQVVATVHLDVNGVQFDARLDTTARAYTEDGHLGAFYAEDLAALLALRDAFATALPDEVTGTLQGKLLVKLADRLSEAPVGMTFDRRDIVVPEKGDAVQNRADADGCGGDGSACLWGTDGWDYAVFDPGNDGTCVWQWAQYGNHASQCQGRCGAGCAWYDHDYTWDCFDHDRCVDTYGGSTDSGNPNCGDEFWDAADDWVVTVGSWC